MMDTSVFCAQEFLGFNNMYTDYILQSQLVREYLFIGKEKIIMLKRKPGEHKIYFCVDFQVDLLVLRNNVQKAQEVHYITVLSNCLLSMQLPKNKPPPSLSFLKIMSYKIIMITCGNTKGEKKTQSLILQPNNLGKITICKLTILKHTSLSYYLSYYFEAKCTQENQHSIMGFIFYAFSKIDCEFLQPWILQSFIHRHIPTYIYVFILL